MDAEDRSCAGMAISRVFGCGRDDAFNLVDRLRWRAFPLFESFETGRISPLKAALMSRRLLMRVAMGLT